MLAATTTMLSQLLQGPSALSKEDAKLVWNWWIESSKKANFLDWCIEEGIIVSDELRTVTAFRKGYLSADAKDLMLETHMKPRLQGKLLWLLGQAQTSQLEKAAAKLLPEMKPLETPKPVVHQSMAVAHTDKLPQLTDPENVLFFPPQPNGPLSAISSTRPTPRGFFREDEKHETVQPGDMVGKCKLVELIGSGGNGKVFRAVHSMLNICVAIKVLRPDLVRGRNSKLTAKFVAEAQTLARLNHPNIVRILDFDYDPVPHLVLEFVEGMSLSELINQSGSLRSDRAIDIVLRAADGLHVARKAGIIHRDVKPANILLSREGVVKLADFGLAIDVDAKPDSYKEPLGTVAYISPEQIMNPGKVDQRSDIYSLGATFYHMVTGRVVYPTKNAYEAMMMHMQERPIAPIELAPEVPKMVSDLIMKMLAKSPDERFQTYDSLRATLRGLQTCLGYFSASNTVYQSASTHADPSDNIDQTKQVRLEAKKNLPPTTPRKPTP
jgi:hypothetical protein